MARGGAASHRCRRSHCVKASALNGQGGRPHPSRPDPALPGHGTGERGARTGLCRLPTRLCGGRRPLHFSGNLHFYSVCVSFFFFCCFNTLPLLSGSETHTCTKEGSSNTSPLTPGKRQTRCLPVRSLKEAPRAAQGAGHPTSPRVCSAAGDHRPPSQQAYAAIKDLVKCLQRITQRMTQRVPFLIHQNLPEHPRFSVSL